jgi:hypothetical protein
VLPAQLAIMEGQCHVRIGAHLAEIPSATDGGWVEMQMQRLRRLIHKSWFYLEFGPDREAAVSKPCKDLECLILYHVGVTGTG